MTADVGGIAGFDLIPKVDEHTRVSPGLCSVVSEDSSGEFAHPLGKSFPPSLRDTFLF